MNRFDEILNQLRRHKEKIDKIVSHYRRSCAEKQEQYSETYYKLEQAKLLGTARGNILGEQEDTRHSINLIIEEIQDDLKKWVQTPVQKSSLDLLVTLDTMDIPLSETELEALADSLSNNYFAGRLIQHLAEKNKITSFKRFSKTPLDDYVAALRSVVAACDLFVDNYVGDSAPFPYELFSDSNRPKYDKLVASAATCNILEGGSILYAALLWGDGVPNSSIKTKLTEADTAALDRLYSGCRNDDDFSRKTAQIVNEAPALKELIELSPRYSKFL